MRFLLFTACVAMGLVIWRLNQHIEDLGRCNGLLDDENRRLYNEVGRFKVEHPERLYADQIRRDITHATQNRYWAWRVWVPEGKRYLLNYADGVIGLNGLPAPSISEPIESGDVIVQLWYEFDHTFKPSGGWRVRLAIRGRTEKGNLSWSTSRLVQNSPWPDLAIESDSKAPIFQPDEGVGWGVSTVGSDRSQEVGQQVVLQRMRVQSVERKDGGYQVYDDIPNFDPKAKAPGFIIWLKPTK